MAGDSSLLSGCPFSPCACSHPSCGLLFFLHSQRPFLSPVSSGTPNKASGNTSSQRLSQMLADTLTFFLPFISQETMGLCTSCRRAPKFQRPVCPLHFALRVSQIQGLSLSRPSALTPELHASPEAIIFRTYIKSFNNSAQNLLLASTPLRLDLPRPRVLTSTLPLEQPCQLLPPPSCLALLWYSSQHLAFQ